MYQAHQAQGVPLNITWMPTANIPQLQSAWGQPFSLPPPVQLGHAAPPVQRGQAAPQAQLVVRAPDGYAWVPVPFGGVRPCAHR